MNLDSQNKVLKAGFMIIRKDDYPQPKIKYKQFGFPEWRTLEKFPTKAAGIVAIKNCCMTAA